jgi:hypothetical protein
LRFVLTPIPPVAQEQRQVWISNVEDWIEENWGLLNNQTVRVLYYEVNYNSNFSTLSSLVNNLPKSLLDNYLSIAESIDASLPDFKSSLKTTNTINKDTKDAV